jgi:hypothetical protein
MRQITGMQIAYTNEEAAGVPLYYGVTYGATAGGVKLPTADNAVPVGFVTHDELLSTGISQVGSKVGRTISVQVDGYAGCILSGTCSFGDALILAATGKVKKLPVAAGTYNVVGYAESDGASGDVITFFQRLHTVVVA